MSEQDFQQMRRAMVVGSLRTTGVSDPRVLAAMGAVPRERFVPRDRAAIAYADNPVPLGGGRELNSPLALGRMLTDAAPQPGERTLVIGAATGYAAAVLARLVGWVVAVEEEASLLATAREALAGIENIKLVEASLTAGYPDSAPYDFILVDGAVELIPDALVDQLGDGGRMAVALLDQGVSRLSIGRKAGSGFGIAPTSDRDAAILPGFARPAVFAF